MDYIGEKIVGAIIIIGLLTGIIFSIRNSIVQDANPEGMAYGAWTDGAGW